MTNDASALMTAQQVMQAIGLRQLAVEDCLQRQQLALEPLNVEQDDLNRRYGEINSLYHKESGELKRSLTGLEQQLADIQEKCPHLGQAINVVSPERAIEYILPDKRRMVMGIGDCGIPLSAARSHGQCPDCFLEQLVVCPECSGLIQRPRNQVASVQRFDISWWRDAPNRGSQLIDGVDQQFVEFFGLESLPKTLDEFIFAKTNCQLVTWFDGKPGRPFWDSQPLFIQFHDESGIRMDAYQAECPHCSVQLVDVLVFPYVNWGPK